MDPMNIGGKPAFTSETIKTFETRVSGKGVPDAFTPLEIKALNQIMDILCHAGYDDQYIALDEMLKKRGLDLERFNANP